MTNPESTLPTFEARHIGGTWDITMRIPSPVPGAGATVESILAVKETCGYATNEDVVAQRVTALLNLSAHIDTEDLAIKGASLQLAYPLAGSPVTAIKAEREMTDRESDLIDTCEALRRSLRIIGNKFDVKLGADSDMFASRIVEEHEKLQARFSQADYALNDHSEAISMLREHFMIPTSSGPVAVAATVKVKADESARIATEHTKTVNELRAIFGASEATPSSLMTLTRNAKENAELLNQAACDRGDAQHTLNAIREALEVDPDYEYAELPRIAAELFAERASLQAGCKELSEKNQNNLQFAEKAGNELAEARGALNESLRIIKSIERALGVVTEHPTQLEALIIERLNQLTSIQSAQTTIQPFKIQVMQLCMIEPSSPSMLPSLPELLIGIRDYINNLTSYRGGALILHDLACQLTGTEVKATDADPYANIPWRIIADRLEEQFYAPRTAINTLLGNYELEVADDWRDNVSQLYTFIKGLTVAQYQHDKQLQTLLAERNADRAIIGAIDDLCGDKLNRPAAPVMAAIHALVATHIRAIYSKEKTNG